MYVLLLPLQQSLSYIYKYRGRKLLYLLGFVVNGFGHIFFGYIQGVSKIINRKFVRFSVANY